MYRDEIKKDIKKTGKRIMDITETESLEDMFEKAFNYLDAQQEHLVNLMLSLIRVYNIEPELRYEVAEYVQDAIEDNKDLRFFLSRIQKQKTTKKTK